MVSRFQQFDGGALSLRLHCNDSPAFFGTTYYHTLTSLAQ